MNIPCFNWQMGFAALVCALGSSAVDGSEPVRQLTGIVIDEEGRPLEGATIQVCGEEHKLPDGRWDRNHSPDCILPRASIGQAGRFTVPFDEREVRLNLWINIEGFAPAYVAGVTPQPQAVKMVLQRGIQVSGHVSRLVKGEAEPVKGVAVYLGCSSGDPAQLQRVFEDPYFFVMKLKEGDDLPFLRTVFTGHFGEYVFQLSPPPKDKKWFLVCLDKLVTLEVTGGQPTPGPDFLVQAQIREPAKSVVPAAAPIDR